MKFLGPIAAALALGWASFAFGQAAPTVGQYRNPGSTQNLPAVGVQIIGYDSVTGAPCVPGQAATCGGVGGGAATLGAGSVSAGAYVAGSVLANAYATCAIVDIGCGATPAANTLNNYAQTIANAQGAQGTGSTYNPPAGGSGILGYLSGIFKAITGTLTTQGNQTVGGSGITPWTDAVDTRTAVYGYNGTTYDAISAVLNGTAHALLFDENTSSQLHSDLNSGVGSPGVSDPATDIALGFSNVGTNAKVGTANPLPVTTYPLAVTPAAGTAHVITTGGTAVTFVTGPVKGCYITNPLTLTDQNIAAAEPLYVNPITTATTSSLNGSSVALAPGQTYYCPAGQSTNVSANALTSSHNAVVVAW
jgi:hypothetical protein